MSEAIHASAVLARTWESIAIVLKDRRLSAILLVTIIYNIFAWPFTSMIPVIGRDQLRLGPEGVGLLTSVDGVGAFVGALVLALWLTPGWHARAYVGGVVVYLLSLIAFALAPEAVSSDPAAISWGPGRMDVAARGTDGGYWLKSFTGSTWTGIGSATLTNNPSGRNYFSVAVLPTTRPRLSPSFSSTPTRS